MTLSWVTRGRGVSLHCGEGDKEFGRIVTDHETYLPYGFTKKDLVPTAMALMKDTPFLLLILLHL